MINLLPYDTKKQIKAARTNIVLLQYIVVLGIAILFAALAVAGSYLVLMIEQGTVDQALEQNSAKVVTPDSAQGQATIFRNELATSKSILDQQIIYSSVITSLGSLMPSGVILDSLSLNDSSFGATVELKARAKSEDLESKLKDNFSNSRIFSNYTLISKNNDNGYVGYPTSISFSVTLNKEVQK